MLEGFRARRDRDAGAMRQRSPLIGRRDVLRTLSGLLTDAARGKGELVHLVGEPGVGKSRLLAELRAAAAPKDFVFVHGRADEADAEGRFGALGDLVADLCGVEPEDTPAQRFEKVERLRVLGLGPRDVRMVGELLGLAYPLPSEERAGRPRGIELALAMRKAIRALAQERVVVLALEDLHWMDDATRQVLPLLVQGLTHARVLVLLTRRPGTAGPLPSGGRTVEVAPLARDATGRLFAHRLGARAVEPEVATFVHGETGGVPLWVELVAEPLRPHVTIEDRVVRGGEPPSEPLLPDAVRSAVAARIELLRPRARAILRAAAAMRGTVDVRTLSAVEGLIGHTERPALRRLLVRGLLVPEDVRAPLPERLGAWGGDEEDGRLPTRVRVPSELLRRAVLAELDPGELGRLHARVMATLERLGSPDDLESLERLAEHAVRASDRRRAPEYLARAGEVARTVGHDARAAAHFERAAAVARELSGDPADGEAFELGLRAAEAGLDAGALSIVQQALAPLAEVASRTSPGQAVRRAILDARWARRRIEPEHAIRALSAVADALPAVSVEARLEVCCALAWARLEQGANEETLDLLDRALADVEGSGRGRLLALRAVALARARRGAEAHAAMSEALAIAARSGEGVLRYGALNAMAIVLEAQGDLEAAAARYREAAEVALAVREESELARLHAHAASLSLLSADDDAAARHAEAAARWARELEQEPWQLVVSAIRGAIAIRAHPAATHVPGIVQAIDGLEALGRPRHAALAVDMLALAHLALGDDAAAERTLERAAGLAERGGALAHAARVRGRLAARGAP